MQSRRRGKGAAVCTLVAEGLSFEKGVWGWAQLLTCSGVGGDSLKDVSQVPSPAQGVNV